MFSIAIPPLADVDADGSQCAVKYKLDKMHMEDIFLGRKSNLREKPKEGNNMIL